MKIIDIRLPKPSVMALWSLIVAYTQKGLVEENTKDKFFKMIDKLARAYDSAKTSEHVKMLFSYDDAVFIWNMVNQACLSGVNDGIITDVKQHLILSEILTQFAIELDK